MRKRPLIARREKDELVIRIGIATLAFATEHSERFDIDNSPRVVSLKLWAEDILAELNKEEEDGTTPIQLMFDQAFLCAAENGSGGVVFPEDSISRADKAMDDGGSTK